MNRRDFLKKSAAALFGFTVLPPATTYGRIWRAARPPIDTEYNCIMLAPPPIFVLSSEVITTIWEQPEKMLLIENFSYGPDTRRTENP